MSLSFYIVHHILPSACPHTHHSQLPRVSHHITSHRVIVHPIIEVQLRSAARLPLGAVQLLPSVVLCFSYPFP